MVQASIIAGVFGFLGTLFLGFLYVTLWTWRHSASLGGDDEERVVELESHRQSLVDDELTRLYTEIEELSDDPEQLPEDMSKRDHVANIIHREIGKKDIEPIVEQLDQVDRPEENFDEHKQAYRLASKEFLYGGVATLALGASMAGVTIYQGGPFGNSGEPIYLLLIAGIVNFGYTGAKNFLQAQSLKDEFEEMWREYKRID